MRDRKQVHVDTGIDVDFCDPQAHGNTVQREHQRAAAPVLPKGTDFATVTEAQLDAVADELNDRPRKRLAFAKPTEQLAELLLR